MLCMRTYQGTARSKELRTRSDFVAPFYLKESSQYKMVALPGQGIMELEEPQDPVLVEALSSTLLLVFNKQGRWIGCGREGEKWSRSSPCFLYAAAAGSFWTSGILIKCDDMVGMHEQ